ncbi:MAG: 3-hydroxyacyl-CoA dehydrogenase family protein [Nitrososphaerales archaeon]
MSKQPVRIVAVVGAGVMGRGISQALAQGGYRVNLTDADERALSAVVKKIRSDTNWMVVQELLSRKSADKIFSNLQTMPDLAKAVEKADFVIEAVYEDLKIKRKIFRELDLVCQKHTILASNTSSISLDEIASATGRSDRCVGMHWWNPAHLMPLVEVVKGKRTSSSTVNLTKKVAIKAGKKPVVCKDSPGLLGVRMQAALVIESIRILEEGLATPEEIDMAVMLTLGLRLPNFGPLRLVDLGGLDVFEDAYEYLGEKLGDRLKPPKKLKKLAASGNLGIKSGNGFYSYGRGSTKALINKRDEWVARIIKDLRRKPRMLR